MIIADALLLFEVMNEQRKQTPTGFIIGNYKFAEQIFADNVAPAEDLFILDDLPEDVRFDSMYPQPYSKSLLRKPLGLIDGCSEQVSELSEILPPMPDLDDTRRHIFEMEMELAGVAGVAGVADMADTETDVSSFFK